MPNPRDFLPPPPWEGPPVPRAFIDASTRYGPPETADPELKKIWRDVLAETRQKYPVDHPMVLAEAKRAGISPEDIQLRIAHELWLEKKRVLIERWRKDFEAEEEEDEEEVPDEED